MIDTEVFTIPPMHGKGLELRKGERLRVIDPEGEQVCDLVAFKSRDTTEWLSNGRSFDYNGSIYLTTGNTLYSNKSNEMLRIVEDQVGHHDFLFTACSPEMYRIQYGEVNHHANCLENIAQALAYFGVNECLVPTPFNIFQYSKVMADGRIVIEAPRSRAGQWIEFEAEMDLSIALSACSAATCNGGACKPVCYEVIA